MDKEKYSCRQTLLVCLHPMSTLFYLSTRIVTYYVGLSSRGLWHLGFVLVRLVVKQLMKKKIRKNQGNSYVIEKVLWRRRTDTDFYLY